MMRVCLKGANRLRSGKAHGLTGVFLDVQWIAEALRCLTRTPFAAFGEP